MTEFPTQEHKGRMVLEIFKHYGIQPGGALRQEHFQALAMQWDWRRDHLADGIDYGGTVGWFEGGPDGSLRLTEAGFAEI